MSIAVSVALSPPKLMTRQGFPVFVRNVSPLFGAELSAITSRRQLLQAARIRCEGGADLAVAGLDEGKVRGLVLEAFEQAERASKTRNARQGVSWGAAAYGNFLKKGRPVNTFEVSDRNLPHLYRNYLCAERNTLKKAEEALVDEHQGDSAVINAMAVVNFSFDQSELVKMTPCLICLDAFEHSDGLMNPQTLLIALEKKEHGEVEIVVNPLQAFLPLMGRQQPSYTDHPIRTLPVRYSDKALAILRDRKSDSNVYTLMEEARRGYEESLAFRRSSRNGRYAGAAIQLCHESSPPRVVRGASLHAKNSYYTLPEVDAVSRALTHPEPASLGQRLIDWLGQLRRKLGKRPMSGQLNSLEGGKPAEGLAMVAYFSKIDSEHPGIQGLGALYKLSGNDQLLVVVIDKDSKGRELLQVRALDDYLPHRYTKKHDLQA